MKIKITLILSVFFALSLSAQKQHAGMQNALKFEKPAKPMVAESTVAVDTLVPYPAGCDSALYLTGVTGGGYVMGTNDYGDLEKAQLFPTTASGTVTDVMVFFGAKEIVGTPDNITAKIYSGTAAGGPTTLLGTSDPVSVTNVDTSGQFTVFTFSTPVSYTGEFFASIEVGAGNDTVGIIHTGTGCLTNAWEMWSDNTWFNVDAAWGGFDVSMIMYAVVDVNTSACNVPSALGAANITTTSADLFWTTGGASDWNVQYGTTGFTLGSGMVVNSTNDTLGLTGLTSNTFYDFYVRDSCGPGDVSSWAGPFTFKTACTVISLPYVETFEVSSSSSLSCVMAQSNWAIGNVGGYGNSSNSLLFPFYDVQTGTFSAFSPEFTPTSANYALNFDYAKAAYDTEADSLEIYYSTDGGATYSLLVALDGSASGTLNTAGTTMSPYTPSGAAEWATYSTTLPTGVNRIRIDAISDYGNNLYIDNFSVAIPATCPDPSAPGATNITANSADLSWTSGGAADHNVEYGPLGFAPGTGTIINTTTNTATLTALAPGTCYSFYVRDSCGMGDVSAWVGPYSFCTSGSCAGNIAAPTADNDTVCSNGLVSFNASGSGDDFLWYRAGGDTVLASGQTFSDSIFSNTDFDVAAVEAGPLRMNFGPEITLASNAYPPANYTNGQYITVHDTVRIDSTTLMSNGPIGGFVGVTDVQQTAILQLSKPIALSGADTAAVEVGIVLTPGNYFMRFFFTAGTGILWRPTSGASFPYGYNGLMTVDSVNFSTQNRYYYMYEMVVSEACIGPRTTVSGVIAPSGNAGVDVSDTICDTLAPVDLNNYLGGNVSTGGSFEDISGTGALSGSMFDPSMVAAGNAYTFNYVISATADCPGDTAIFTIYVDECTIGLDEFDMGAVSLYPNPTNGVVFFEVKESVSNDMKLEVYAVNGQLLISKKLSAHNPAVDISHLAEGIYNFKVTTAENVEVYRVTKSK